MLKSWNTFLSIGSVVDLSAFMSCFVVQLNIKYWAQEMKLGGFSYPETQTMALMASSDLQNLQICSESGIMKQQRVNPFKIGSKCQGLHFKHTKTQVHWQSLPNSPQITRVLHHRPFISFIRIANNKHWMSKSSCFQTRGCFEILGFKNERKRHLPHSKWCILGSPFTCPHLPTFSQACSHLCTLLPSANPCTTSCWGTWGKMFLGWQSHLQEHKSHQSERAVLYLGLFSSAPQGPPAWLALGLCVLLWAPDKRKILVGHGGH